MQPSATLAYQDEQSNTMTFTLLSPNVNNDLTTDAAGRLYLNVASATTSQTITNLSQATNTGIITYSNENGVIQTASVVSTATGNALSVGTDGGAYLASSTFNQTLTASALSANNTMTLAISDGNTVTLDFGNLNTDEQNIDALAFDSTTSSLTVGITGGTSQTISLAALNTDEQTLAASALSANNTMTLAISDGNTVTLDFSNLNTDEQNIDALAFDSATSSLTVGITGGTSQTISLADLNTDEQTLAASALSANNTMTLAISDGNTVTLDFGNLNTDEQNIDALAFDSTTSSLTVGITGGTSQTISLAALNTDSQTLAFAASATTTQTTLTIAGGNALTLQASGGLTFNQTGTNTLEMVATAADATRLVDTDGDTQIQVEEGVDDDTIRFDTANTERMVLDENGVLSLSGASEMTPTGSDGEIIGTGGFEAYSSANFTYYNTTGVVGREGDGLFDNDVAEKPLDTFITSMDTAGLDWGIGYSMSTAYQITGVRIHTRSGCCSDRGTGGEFRLYNNGTLVASSTLVASAGPGVWTPYYTPNVIADEVRYIFPDGAMNNEGGHSLVFVEFEIRGASCRRNSTHQSSRRIWKCNSRSRVTCYWYCEPYPQFNGKRYSTSHRTIVRQ